MLTMLPPPWRSITGSTCLQARNTLLRFRSTWASHTSSLISTGPPGAEPPTLFTTTSMRPQRSRHAATICATPRASVTSQVCVATPGALSTVSRSAAASRSTANTFAPSSTKRTVVARPLPQPGPTEPAPLTSATLSLRRKAIQALRIVDQQALALGLARRHVGDEIHEIAVVWHFGEIRMRPVAAPESAIAELGDEFPCEGRCVWPGRALARNALGAAHLHPEVLRPHQIEERAELGAVDAFGRIDAAHVVDDHRDRRALERRRQLGDAATGYMDLQSPANLGEPRCHGEHRVDRIAGAQMLHIVEAHAAKAGAMQAFQFSERCGSGSQGDAAVVLWSRRDQIGGGGVVETVRRRLHDDAVLDAEVRVQREQRFLRRIAGRRVAALGREGESARRPEDMEMRIAGAARQREAGLSRLRLE